MRSVILIVAIALALVSWDVEPASANGILVTTVRRGDQTGPDRAEPLPTPTTQQPNRLRIARRTPVTLKGHSVTAVVNDNVAEVTVEQVFHNSSGRQLEGTYLFPLPEGASVSQWAMTMGGKMVQGEIMEASRARRIYEDIVRRRRDPGLLEYMGRGLFKARVFPIMPRSDLTIRLTFQQVLPEDGGTLEFRYPLATDRFNHTPVQSTVIDIKVDSSVDLKAIYSPTHSVEVTRNGDRKARIGYERSGRKQDKDLVVYIGRSTDGVGFSVQSHRPIGKDGTFMMVLAPRTEVPADQLIPKDVVYVLDTSSSMAGPKMEQARRALQYGVRLLRPDDRFNVIGFATNIYPFQDEMKAATSQMKEAAVKWIDGMQPRGPTNIDGALKAALALRGEGDRLFMIVFITDGKPTVVERDPNKILANVKAANSANTRIFTFGVGYDLDVSLLDRIAEATRGARDYVRPDEDIEVVTGRFFKKVEQPVLSDVSIDYGPGVVEVFPRQLPDLFAGTQVVVFGRYKESGDRTIRLKGKVGSKVVSIEYQATLRNGEGAGYLPRLWAHRKVAFLLDEIRLHGANRELIDEVIRLATRYAIVTPYTAGLVVEENEMIDGRRFDAPSRRARRSLGGLIPGRVGATDRGAGGALPTPMPTAPSSEAAKKTKLADSERLREMKEGVGGKAEADDDKWGGDMADALSRVKSAADKTFKRQGKSRWIDSDWDGKATPEKIEAFSTRYFELLKLNAKIAKYLAVAEHVLFVHAGKVYEVVPAK